MPRLVFPDDFASQQQLLANIINQNNSITINNPLTPFLAQQNIDLTLDATAAATAQTHETSRSLLTKQSQNYSQLRDHLFEKPWKDVTGSVQFLKSFYKGNTKQLGAWGITITESGKVNYPASFADRVAVFNNFITQNNSYKVGDSPLQSYITQQQIDLGKDTDAVKKAVENDANFAAASKQSEIETEQRDELWNPVVADMKATGNFLMELYRDNEKTLGNWGFVVDNSPQKPKLRTTKLKLGEKITTKSVVIGSAVTVIGPGEAHIYKGSSTSASPVIVPAGEKFGIAKGWSTITVVNPSVLTDLKFTWATNS